MLTNSRTTESLSEFFDAVHAYFTPRLICLVYCKQQGANRPEFKLASGFVTFIDETAILVTAGHCCQEIYKLKKEESLHGATVVYAKSKFNDEAFHLDIEALPMFWWDEKDDLDIGFMFLESALIERLVASGTKAIQAESASMPSEDSEKVRLAIGFSAEHTIVSDSTSFYVIQDGAEKPIVKSKIGTLGRRVVAMTGFQDQRNSQFIAKPVRKGELSVAGMSGGIIVEFDFGKAIRDFRLVGIQSGQKYKEQRDGKKIATGFFVNNAILALDRIRALFASYKDCLD